MCFFFFPPFPFVFFQQEPRQSIISDHWEESKKARKMCLCWAPCFPFLTPLEGRMPRTQFDSEPSAGSKTLLHFNTMLAPGDWRLYISTTCEIRLLIRADVSAEKRMRRWIPRVLLMSLRFFSILSFFFFFLAFPHPERSKDSGCFHKCSKAFVSALWFTSLSTEVMPARGPDSWTRVEKWASRQTAVFFFHLTVNICMTHLSSSI